jgi:Xaa-Pro aminopeptidase
MSVKSNLPLAERDLRMSSLRHAASFENMDALLFAGKGHYWTGRGAIRYLTDFHLWAHDSLLLLPVDGAPAMTVNSHGVAKRVIERGWLEDVRGDYRLVRGIADAIRERNLTTARIGLVGLQWVLPAGVRDELLTMLPNVTFVPGDDVFNAVRAIKSPLEIEQCRQLWPVMRAAMSSFEEALSPGVAQREAVAASAATAVAMGAREVLAFIGESPDEYGVPENVPMRCNDVVRLHLEICGESGHWCERTMTFAFRDPTPREQALLHAEVRAFEAVRQAAIPGRTLSHISSVFVDTMTEQGWAASGVSAHLDFHGQGLDAIEFPYFSSYDPAGTFGDAVLREGQVFSYHPSRPYVGMAGWLPDIHDNILIGSAGAIRLSGDWDFEWRRMA